MNLIQCAKNCKYQNDGYCNLNVCGNVTSPDNECPYFVASLLDNGKSLLQGADTDKLD